MRALKEFEIINLAKNFDTNCVDKIKFYHDNYQNEETCNFFDKIFVILQTSGKENVFFRKNLEIVNELMGDSFNYNNLIRNNYDFFIAYLSFFIVKNFWTITANKENQVYHYSDAKSNAIQEDLSNMMKFYIIKLELNSILFKELKFRKIVQFAINKLVKENLINQYNRKIITNVGGKAILREKKILFIDQKFIIKPSPILHENEFRYDEGHKLLYSIHYSEVYEVFKKNKASGAIFEFYDKSQILELCKKNYFLDIQLLKTLFDELLKIKKIEIQDIEINYETLIFLLKKHIKNKNFIEIKSLSQTLSTYEELLLIKKIIEKGKFTNELEIKIFMPFMYDFRSRFYYLSDISPTFKKIFRYSLHFGIYSDSENFKDHTLLLNVNNEIDRHLHYLNKIENFDFSTKTMNVKRGIIWFLISIGEIFKTSFKNQECDGVGIEDFIQKGVETVNAYNKQIFIKNDVDNHIKIIYVIFVLNEINENIFKKRPISKDATASCFQHLIKILGFANKESLKWCNLSSQNRWYDTYSHIIKLFKLNVRLEYLTSKEFDEIFTRKIKKVMMTQGYAAGKETCWRYFLEVIDLSTYSQQQINEIEIIFDNFYTFLENNTAILKHPTSHLLTYFRKYGQIITFEDLSKVNLQYKKIKKIQKEVRVDKKRYTYTDAILTQKEDAIKFNNSARANYIHSLDGYLAIWIRKDDCVILTIHDCFIIDYQNTSYLIAKLNEGMRLFFHDIQLDSRINTDNLFSIFIVI